MRDVEACLHDTPKGVEWVQVVKKRRCLMPYMVVQKKCNACGVLFEVVIS